MAIIIWAATFATAQAIGLEVALGVWQQESGGELAYNGESIDDVLDIDDDLNYDTETKLQLRGKIDLPLFLPNIYLLLSPAEFDGDGMKSVDFTFGDQDFTRDEPFYSKLTYNQYDVGLYYGLPFINTATLGKLNVDVGLNLRFIDMEAKLEQETTGVSEKQDVSIVIPQLYVGVQLETVDWLTIEAEGRALSISDNNLYSLIGRVRFKVFGPAFVAAGYRQDVVDIDEDDIEVDFTIQGPFLEAGLKF